MRRLWICIVVAASALPVFADGYPPLAQTFADAAAAGREIRDLQAQEGMAWWAAAMFWVTLASSLVGGLGLVGLFVSLYQTRAAIKHARETSFIDVRPWLLIEGVEITSTAGVYDEKGFHFTAQGSINVRNAGKLPAEALAHVVTFGPTADSARPLTEALHARIEELDGNGYIVPPGQSFRLPLLLQVEMTSEEAEKIADEMLRLSISAHYQTAGLERDFRTIAGASALPSVGNHKPLTIKDFKVYRESWHLDRLMYGVLT
ncbi:hypothetical protein [Rhizobium johnstonii]|uniref:hypothetical protein n=1 Tax=Rhizobium johnstonii TaxID=3019933 RepID=UPI003F98B9B7